MYFRNSDLISAIIADVLRFAILRLLLDITAIKVCVLELQLAPRQIQCSGESLIAICGCTLGSLRLLLGNASPLRIGTCDQGQLSC